MGDRAQKRADAPLVTAKLEDFLDDGPVLALELTRQMRRGRLVGPFVDRHTQHAVLVGLRRARDAAVKPDQ